MPGYGRESNPEPVDSESRVQSNIPRHLHLSKVPVINGHVQVVLNGITIYGGML